MRRLPKCPDGPAPKPPPLPPGLELLPPPPPKYPPPPPPKYPPPQVVLWPAQKPATVSTVAPAPKLPPDSPELSTSDQSLLPGLAPVLRLPPPRPAESRSKLPDSWAGRQLPLSNGPKMTSQGLETPSSRPRRVSQELPSAGLFVSDPSAGLFVSDPSAGLFVSDPSAGLFVSDPHEEGVPWPEQLQAGSPRVVFSPMHYSTPIETFDQIWGRPFQGFGMFYTPIVGGLSR